MLRWDAVARHDVQIADQREAGVDVAREGHSHVPVNRMHFLNAVELAIRSTPGRVVKGDPRVGNEDAARKKPRHANHPSHWTPG